MTTNKDIKELLQVKEKIREEEITKSRIEGTLEALKKSLKKFGGTVKVATNKLKEMQKSIEDIDKQMDKGFDKLEDLGFI